MVGDGAGSVGKHQAGVTKGAGEFPFLQGWQQYLRLDGDGTAA
jgi:hypothetical protein